MARRWNTWAPCRECKECGGEVPRGGVVGDEWRCPKCGTVLVMVPFRRKCRLPHETGKPLRAAAR